MKKFLRYDESNRKAFIHDASVKLLEMTLSPGSAKFPERGITLELVGESVKGLLTEAEQCGAQTLRVRPRGPNGNPVSFVQIRTYDQLKALAEHRREDERSLIRSNIGESMRRSGFEAHVRDILDSAGFDRKSYRFEADGSLNVGHSMGIAKAIVDAIRHSKEILTEVTPKRGEEGEDILILFVY